MKQPKLSDLQVEQPGTERIRAAMARTKTIKITINLDAESLTQLRQLADESGVPYQRLLNQVLKKGLAKRETTEARLARLEAEVNKLKRQIAA